MHLNTSNHLTHGWSLLRDKRFNSPSRVLIRFCSIHCFFPHFIYIQFSLFNHQVSLFKRCTSQVAATTGRAPSNLDPPQHLHIEFLPRYSRLEKRRRKSSMTWILFKDQFLLSMRPQLGIQEKKRIIFFLCQPLRSKTVVLSNLLQK